MPSGSGTTPSAVSLQRTTLIGPRPTATATPAACGHAAITSGPSQRSNGLAESAAQRATPRAVDAQGQPGPATVEAFKTTAARLTIPISRRIEERLTSLPRCLPSRVRTMLTTAFVVTADRRRGAREGARLGLNEGLNDRANVVTERSGQRLRQRPEEGQTDGLRQDGDRGNGRGLCARPITEGAGRRGAA